MPEIILNNHPHDLGWIQSTMVFPNDENLRNQNYAVEVAQYELKEMARLSRKWMSSTSSISEIPINSRCLELLIEAPAKSELQRLRSENTRKAIVAGNILLSYYLMEKCGVPEPSMKKAVYLCKNYAKKNKYGDGSRMDISEAKIRKCWEQYKSVSHFWSALRLHQDYLLTDASDVFSEEVFPYFLQVVAEIYHFGINFVSMRGKTKKAILDSKTCWYLNDGIKPANLELPKEICEVLAKRLEKYTAPRTKY